MPLKVMVVERVTGMVFLPHGAALPYPRRFSAQQDSVNLISNRDNNSNSATVATLRAALIRPDRLPRRFLDWLCAGRADYRAFRARRRTRSYRIRRGYCKSLWIIAGLIMLVHPSLPVFLVGVLLTTLVCFAFLDESD